MKEEAIIKIYNKAISSHKSYTKMNKIIANFVHGKILEIGAGTGLLTKEILKKNR